jgi:hypothetical protein
MMRVLMAMFLFALRAKEDELSFSFTSDRCTFVRCLVSYEVAQFTYFSVLGSNFPFHMWAPVSN